MPRLSIIVPVHNGAATLARVLDALGAERGQDDELIVVDDGSTDGSVAIAERYPARLVRHATRRGASAARATGIATATAEILVFVDADVVVRPGALAWLLAALDDTTVGANGVLALDIAAPGVVTAFTNTSIHYQHLRDGARVATAFTGLCALRRSATAFEPGTSRFADDVSTRWHLPPGAIALVPEAQGEHLKAISLGGLLRHRRNVGYHFVRSVARNQQAARSRPRSVVLAARYPLNTLAAALSLTPLAAPLYLVANADFVRFTAAHRGLREAAFALPLSIIESYAYLAGMVLAVLPGRPA